MTRLFRRRVVALFALVLAVPACQPSMTDQPSYRTLEPSTFFPDGRSARPVVAGTVARGQLRTDTALYEGKDDKGEFVATFPFAVDAKVLERGEQRFNVFCSVCHGPAGYGDGRIVQRGFIKPPSYHATPPPWYSGSEPFAGNESRYFKLRGKDIALTDVPVGYIYDIISRGYGAMPDQASQIPVNDRWAIVAYVRALQYSQAPDAVRAKLAATWEQGKGEQK